MRRFRFTIGQFMVAVAVLAAAMATFGPRFAPAFLATALAPAAAFVAARRLWGLPRSRVAAWIFAAYPLAMLGAHYSCWAVSYAMTGRRPGVRVMDRPMTLGFPAADLEGIFVLLLVGSVPAAWLCIGFVLAESVKATRDEPAGPRPALLALLIASAAGAWILPVVLAMADPVGSFAWFWD